MCFWEVEQSRKKNRDCKKYSVKIYTAIVEDRSGRAKRMIKDGE